ncbi:hypothetical protein AN665_0211575 [Serratia marcescens]|nr:hypothetical protein AN699_0214535 [Serratia marcescens]OCN21822.1 hypothetical protein AN701_0214390 [Serratia marcescens]OCN44411.1 hypothetical protein AN658_0213490 [Serratia marcescens]OCN44774.1 hypothetical protein AN660_0213870 [Serratia marcescens]OCN67370.1 hypothetical protein AN665_0211575 [Serratia marcescens]
MFAGKKSAQIREILISESAWEEMTCLFAPSLGLERFIRRKEEINKEAILNEPSAVSGVAGITVKTGIEDFAIVPFEQDAGV